MTVMGKEELFDKDGNLPVWGHVSGSGKPYYTFQLTAEDKYIFFPMNQQNPKAPKFSLKKVDSGKAKE